MLKLTFNNFKGFQSEKNNKLVYFDKLTIFWLCKWINLVITLIEFGVQNIKIQQLSMVVVGNVGDI